MGAKVDSLFRLGGPSKEDIDHFHDEGYIVYRDVLTDEAREKLIGEITRHEPVRQYLDALRQGPPGEPRAYFERPWNERGPCSDRFIDDPFVRALLQATIGADYHFCHSAINIAPRGADPVPYHQDHHHWKHDFPLNRAERDKYYIQLLYYPNGFALGDRNLKVIPGSHRVAPTEAATPARMLAGEFDAEAGRQLEEKPLALPPGSMVCINARIFHGVEPKPQDSPVPYRIFYIDIFKEAGPPHRYTQEIPPAWLERAAPERRKLFMRAAYREGCWNA